MRGAVPAALVLLAGVLVLTGLSGWAPGSPVATADAAAVTTYTNPLRPVISGSRRVENCPDPAVQRGMGTDSRYWFMLCTSGSLDDVDARARRGRTVPVLRSTDLVHWTLVGSAASARPSWAAPGASLWAPDITWSSRYRRYVLTYAVTDVVDRVSRQPGCRSDRAIGVAVARHPTGPWTPARAPVVPPRRTGPGCSFADTIDPDLLEASGTTGPILYFGSFGGGVQAAPVALTRSGMRLTGAVRPITAERRYEAPDVVRHAGWYYLVVSAGDCCHGAYSGYSVFAGRARSPWGPFLDRTGASLLAPRTGGTPVVAATGNRWVGPGHTSLFVDRGGQWWAAYHAVDVDRPFLASTTGTRRPVLLDPVDWPGGWPSVRSGRGPSTTPVPVPAARVGQRSAYVPAAAPADPPLAVDAARTDLFDAPPATDPPATDPRDRPARDRPARDGPARDGPARDGPARDRPAGDGPADERPARHQRPGRGRRPRRPRPDRTGRPLVVGPPARGR